MTSRSDPFETQTWCGDPHGPKVWPARLFEPAPEQMPGQTIMGEPWDVVEEDEGVFFAVSGSERVGPYPTREEAAERAAEENADA